MENVRIVGVETKKFLFPAGEVGVQVVGKVYGSKATIRASVQNSEDILTLLMYNDALRRVFKGKVDLHLMYVPYARQDRVCNTGEAHSIKVFASIINSCGFDEVIILDPHSDVTPALINNVFVVESHEVFRHTLDDWSDTVIVSPDAGALKKCEKFAKIVGAKKVVCALKQREVSTGKINRVSLTEDVSDENVFVLDDILDGGGTFDLLSQELIDANHTILAVTHGIFSKGFRVCEKYDQVFTTNSYHPNLKSQGNITVFQL